jgi:hypothetical protein
MAMTFLFWILLFALGFFGGKAYAKTGRSLLSTFKTIAGKLITK